MEIYTLVIKLIRYYYASYLEIIARSIGVIRGWNPAIAVERYHTCAILNPLNTAASSRSFTYHFDWHKSFKRMESTKFQPVQIPNGVGELFIDPCSFEKGGEWQDLEQFWGKEKYRLQDADGQVKPLSSSLEKHLLHDDFLNEPTKKSTLQVRIHNCLLPLCRTVVWNCTCFSIWNLPRFLARLLGV